MLFQCQRLMNSVQDKKNRLVPLRKFRHKRAVAAFIAKAGHEAQGKAERFKNMPQFRIMVGADKFEVPASRQVEKRPFRHREALGDKQLQLQLAQRHPIIFRIIWPPRGQNKIDLRRPEHLLHSLFLTGHVFDCSIREVIQIKLQNTSGQKGQSHIRNADAVIYGILHIGKQLAAVIQLPRS